MARSFNPVLISAMCLTWLFSPLFVYGFWTVSQRTNTEVAPAANEDRESTDAIDRLTDILSDPDATRADKLVAIERLKNIVNDGHPSHRVVTKIGNRRSNRTSCVRQDDKKRNKSKERKKSKRSQQADKKQKQKRKTKQEKSKPLQLEASNLNATLWVQASEEYAATTIAAFQNAERMIDVGLADSTWTALPSQVARTESARNRLAELPTAIILDVDETVLDNSPYAAWRIKANEPFKLETWNRWVADRSAKAIPGAVELIDYARERGVAVFYVTNRDFRGDYDANRNGKIEQQEMNVELQLYTITNLRNVGLLPQEGLSDDESLMLKGEHPNWTSEKVNRRRWVSDRYRVLLLLGDSLGDFVTYDDSVELYEHFENTPTEIRLELRKYQHRWGSTWIQLPNPTYGKWLPREIEQRIKDLDAWRGPTERLKAKPKKEKKSKRNK